MPICIKNRGYYTNQKMYNNYVALQQNVSYTTQNPGLLT